MHKDIMVGYHWSVQMKKKQQINTEVIYGASLNCIPFRNKSVIGKCVY